MLLDHPYDLDKGHWLKGSVHTHSNKSDGRFTRNELIEMYKGIGHGFLMFSDHDICPTLDEINELKDNLQVYQ